MPALSIITVCLNNKHGLERTIQSVIGQTFHNFEFIVVDGGSTDGSVEVLKEYSSRITYWISEKDSGIYNAMNKAIVKSNGDYCLFLNSGDVLYNLQTIEKVFKNRHVEDIIYGNMVIDWNDGRQTFGKMPGKITLKHMIRDTLWHPVSFIKRELFIKYGMYDEQFAIASDYDFFLRTIVKEKCSTLYLNNIISVFTFDGLSSLESNRARLMNERAEIQLRYFKKNEIEKSMELTLYEKIKRKIRTLR